jgi:hypothetical protein
MNQGVFFMPMTDKSLERRQALRFRYNCVVRCARRLAPSAEEFDAYSLDISTSGLCLRTDKPLSVGHRIAVKEFPLLSFCGTFTVQWLRPAQSRSGRAYYVGLEWLELSRAHSSA